MSAAGGERLTETGISVGTVEYMSPEQALGEGEVSAITEVASLLLADGADLNAKEELSVPTYEELLEEY